MGGKGPWELYDMKKDRTELHDVSAQEPDKAKDLTAKWEAWAERTHVKPYPESGTNQKKRRTPKPRPRIRIDPSCPVKIAVKIPLRGFLAMRLFAVLGGSFLPNRPS